jgi:hypothetical protein
MDKVTGFLVAFKDWRAAGYPRRSPEWVSELFETHCRPCPFYDPEGKTPLGTVGICGKCGCHVSDNPETMLNKLVLPTEGCPEGKFNASVERTPLILKKRKPE